LRRESRLSRRSSLHYLAALLVLLAASLLAACGGGGDEKEATADETTEAPAAAAATTPGAETTEVIPPAQALADLTSYRLEMRFTLEGGDTEGMGALSMNLEGAFVAPDRSQTNVSAHLGDLELGEEAITIGDQSWVKAGDSWVEEEPQFDLGDLSPASLLADFDPAQLRVLKPSQETVNGVKSLRYSIDRADIESLSGLSSLFGSDENLVDLPEQFDISLWLAEDGGWPVRITMTAQGAIESGGEISLDFSLDITDVNDPGIKIEAPEA
jgi:hypothetical protein